MEELRGGGAGPSGKSTHPNYKNKIQDSEKGWWETWWGQSILLIITGVIVGLAVWGVTRHYDKPTPSDAVAQPTTQPEPQAAQPEAKAKEIPSPNQAHQQGVRKQKVKIEQHGEGSGAVGGNISQGPCSNLQIGGSNTQASIENCTPTKPLIRSIVVAFRAVCQLRTGYQAPTAAAWIMMTTGSWASFVGLGRTAQLLPRGPEKIDRTLDEVAFYQYFSDDENHALIGAPIEDLVRVTSITITPFWKGGSWCSKVDGTSISVYVNETLVLDAQGPSGNLIPETERLPGGRSIPGWPRPEIPVKFEADRLAQLK